MGVFPIYSFRSGSPPQSGEKDIQWGEVLECWAYTSHHHLGGFSKYSYEIFKGWSGEGLNVNRS